MTAKNRYTVSVNPRQGEPEIEEFTNQRKAWNRYRELTKKYEGMTYPYVTYTDHQIQPLRWTEL